MKKPKLLIVDDEVFNLNILQTDLEDEFEIVRAEDGVIALAKMKEHPDVDVIILDRMMPNMNGMEVVASLKSDPLTKKIPIVMQTAAGQSQQVQEGLRAGVFYYLIKPYDSELLLSIVRKALAESVTVKEFDDYTTSLQTRMRGLMKSAFFNFRTLQDVRSLSYYIASCCPRSDVIVYGLNELMINAIEHGNLNITYLEKMELVKENRWRQEVERRLELRENIHKFATLKFDAGEEAITIKIKDQGKGFDWKSYIDFDPFRLAVDPTGKGIAITKVTSLPDMEYNADGSEVMCRIANGYGNL